MRRAAFWGTLACLGVVGACRETGQAAPRATELAPATQLGARLELSTPPDLPQHLTVRVRTISGTLASFTGSVTYDPRLLRFVGDVSDGGGTVVVNGEGQALVRVAGFRAGGFPDGQLAAITFERLGTSPGDLRLAFTQAAGVDGSDQRGIAILPPLATEGR